MHWCYHLGRSRESNVAKPRQVTFRGFHRTLSARLPARKIAKHMLCGQTVRQVTFLELVQPRPEIFCCPRERGVPHGGTLGRPSNFANDLGDRDMGVCTADDANPQKNTKGTLEHLEKAQNHPAHRHHQFSASHKAIETTSKISLSSQH